MKKNNKKQKRFHYCQVDGPPSLPLRSLFLCLFSPSCLLSPIPPSPFQKGITASSSVCLSLVIIAGCPCQMPLSRTHSPAHGLFSPMYVHFFVIHFIVVPLSCHSQGTAFKHQEVTAVCFPRLTFREVVIIRVYYFTDLSKTSTARCFLLELIWNLIFLPICNFKVL